jgi:hypothetical protein
MFFRSQRINNGIVDTRLFFETEGFINCLPQNVRWRTSIAMKYGANALVK